MKNSHSDEIYTVNIRKSSTNYAYYTNKVRNTEDWVDLGTIEHRRLKFYVLTHNNPKDPEYLIAISLLQVIHLIYIFLIIFGPNFKRLWIEVRTDQGSNRPIKRCGSTKLKLTKERFDHKPAR